MNLLTFYRSSNFVADFKLPGDCFVCVITEADYIGDCKSFRLSLGWLIYKFLANFQITVLPRTRTSPPYLPRSRELYVKISS